MVDGADPVVLSHLSSAKGLLMAFRNPAVIAAFALLTAAAENRLAAQPVAPQRPRSSAFQNLFGPGTPAVPNFAPGGPFAFNQGNNIPLGPNVIGGFAGQQAGANNSAIFPLYPFAGQPVVFNNLGHWYGGNNLGHWYPGGFTNGAGVLAGSGYGGGMNRMGGGAAGGISGGNAFGAGLYTGAATTGVVAGFRAGGGGGGRSGRR